MPAILLLVALALVGVGVILLKRNRKRHGSSGNTYFTHTLGIDDPGAPAAPAAKDDTSAA
ncbi:MAG: hypothetical protein WC804_08935 [Sphingomonas sp.]|jgi:hypothetical protein